jgi:hypothetical protein
VTTPTPTGRPNARLRQTIGDMIRSMALVLVVVGLVLLVTKRPQPDPIKVVDPAPALAAARAQAPYPIAYPATQPEGWRITSAWWSPTTGSGAVPVWHLGQVTGDGAYVQLEQSATTDPDFVGDQVGASAGTSVVGGVTWQRYEEPPNRALVTVSSAGVTTIVSGTAPWDVLEAYAASLRPS